MGGDRWWTGLCLGTEYRLSWPHSIRLSAFWLLAACFVNQTNIYKFVPTPALAPSLAKNFIVQLWLAAPFPYKSMIPRIRWFWLPNYIYSYLFPSNSEAYMLPRLCWRMPKWRRLWRRSTSRSMHWRRRGPITCLHGGHSSTTASKGTQARGFRSTGAVCPSNVIVGPNFLGGWCAKSFLRVWSGEEGITRLVPSLCLGLGCSNLHHD